MVFFNAEVSGQDRWTRSFGIEFMPHSYIPQNDPDRENRFRLGYAVGPCIKFHKNDISIVTGLRYSKVNKHTLYSEDGVSPVTGYYIVETDNKRSLNHIELPFGLGFEFGDDKNKVSLGPGIIASYLIGTSYSGTVSHNYQPKSYSGYNHQEDWIWLGAFNVSYFHAINTKFSYELGQQFQYSFDYHYFLIGVGLRFYFSPVPKK